MKRIKIENPSDHFDFKAAREIANQRAKDELGDCMTLAFFNGDQKLISPWDVKCAAEDDTNCGAESYAQAFDASLEIEVGDRFQFFYYQHDHEYIT